MAAPCAGEDASPEGGEQSPKATWDRNRVFPGWTRQPKARMMDSVFGAPLYSAVWNQDVNVDFSRPDSGVAEVQCTAQVRHSRKSRLKLNLIKNATAIAITAGG